MIISLELASCSPACEFCQSVWNGSVLANTVWAARNSQWSTSTLDTPKTHKSTRFYFAFDAFCRTPLLFSSIPLCQWFHLLLEVLETGFTQCHMTKDLEILAASQWDETSLAVELPWFHLGQLLSGDLVLQNLQKLRIGSPTCANIDGEDLLCHDVLRHHVRHHV